MYAYIYVIYSRVFIILFLFEIKPLKKILFIRNLTWIDLILSNTSKVGKNSKKKNKSYLLFYVLQVKKIIVLYRNTFEYS